LSWDDYLPEPPSEQEPTEDEYCAMSGHKAHYEIEDGLGLICHCGIVVHLTQSEPHDEYTSYCADLIDVYVASLVKVCNKYSMTSYDARFELGQRLRYKSPDYLLSAIASSQASGSQMEEGWMGLTEDRIDFYVKLGTHLNQSGFMMAESLIHHLSGNPGLGPGEFSIGKPDPFGVLNKSDNLKVVQRAAQLYTFLVPAGRGFEWRSKLDDMMVAMIPVLTKRPDLLDAIASLYNDEGYSSSTTERALAMANDEAVTTALSRGFL
jgi:hypothetical protein